MRASERAEPALPLEHWNFPPIDQTGYRGDVAIQRPVGFHKRAYRADCPVDRPRAGPQPACAVDSSVIATALRSNRTTSMAVRAECVPRLTMSWLYCSVGSV